MRTNSNAFAFELTDEHWYNADTVVNSGKNKITGRTYGLTVHNNSVRVVYQPNFKRYGYFHLWWYWYDAGQRYTAYIADVRTGRYIFSLRKQADVVKAKFWDFGKLHKESIRFSKELSSWGLYCFPYFGGKDRAYKKQIWNIEFYKNGR